MQGKVRSSLAAVFVLGFIGCGLAACGGDDGPPTVDVSLQEFEVNPDPISVESGEVELVGDNIGGETHEMVVVAAKDADALPTDADGAVVEDELPDGAFIGEIEDIAAQTSKKTKLKLKSGTYVLFCNITEELDDGTTESHFEKGMHSVLTVK